MREIGESEEMKREFELKALRSQMNPHFLYNTLSVINWKAMERGLMIFVKWYSFFPRFTVQL